MSDGQPELNPWDVTGPDDANVDPFTRDWWERLPRHVQDADRAQKPIPVPLLRFLDGVGHHAGKVRRYTWDLWSGVAVDPATAPDELLPWISYLLGISDEHREHTMGHLREVVQSHVDGGTRSVGTRQHVRAMVRPYLNPGARVQVLASTSALHTLVIGVAPDDVPGQDYERLAQQVRAAGVVPAGHALLVQDIRATWDQWEAVAGDTWEDKESNIRTWEESDYAGVELQ